MDQTTSPLKRIAVALDTSEWGLFRSWCRLFGPRVGVLKVGLEAYIRWGPRAVEEASRHGASVFLDLKLHDIPNTVSGAVRAVGDLGVAWLTVHASGGGRALSAAVDAAEGRLGILAVTLLTHLDEESLKELDLPGEGRERVELWAALARARGCAGVVCSPLEVGSLRQQSRRPFVLVTPGIRLQAGEDRADDQRRTATPGQALAAGADLLVIGRPLTRAPDPSAALAQLEGQLR